MATVPQGLAITEVTFLSLAEFQFVSLVDCCDALAYVIETLLQAQDKCHEVTAVSCQAL